MTSVAKKRGAMFSIPNWVYRYRTYEHSEKQYSAHYHCLHFRVWSSHSLQLPYTVSATYPTCQNNKEPSDPPLAKSPSWTGCQATAVNKNTKTKLLRCQNSTEIEWEAYHSHWPVASFLWPRKTWSSSFRFRMSKSLQRWSRDAVSSQLPLRFNFTSITVFLWAWLETKNQENNPGSEFKTSLNQWSFIFLEKYMVVKLARRLA